MGAGKRLLEDRLDAERDAAIAKAIGLTADEYAEVGGWVEPNEGNDGIIYGYEVFFPDDADRNILSRVTTTELPPLFFEAQDV